MMKSITLDRVIIRNLVSFRLVINFDVIKYFHKNKHQLKKLQIIKQNGDFLTVLLLIIMFLLGISTALIAVIFINMTATAVPDTVTAAAVHVQQNEFTSLLENITESVTYLQHLLNQQVTYLQNNTSTVNLIQQSSTQRLMNIVSTLNDLKGISNSIAGVVDDILLVVEELLEIQNAFVFCTVMFIKKTYDNECLENITESVKLVNQQLMNNTNYTMKLIKQSTENTVNLIQQSSVNSTQQLINIVSTLNYLKGTSTSTAGVVDDILLVVEELLEIQNTFVFLNFIHQPVSCKDIKTVLPNSPTGYYHVNSHNIYCNMGELCGTGEG